MPKTSFMERKEAKLAQKRLYHASYLKAYEYQLKKEGDNEAELLLEDKKETFQKDEEKFLKKAQEQDYRNKHRIWEIDLLRAIVIFAMLFEHLFFDFAYMFPSLFSPAYMEVPFFKTMYDFSCSYWAHPARIAFRFVGLFALAMLIGINTRFSKNNVKRGIILLFFGLVMASVFAILHSITPDIGHAYFNILVIYGLCLLIYSGVEALLKKRFSKAWPWICLGIAVVILVLWGFIRYANLANSVPEKYNNFWFIYNGYAGSIPYVSDIKGLPFGDIFKVFIGITYSGDDWLCFVPTLGYLFLGSFVGHSVYKNGLSLLHYFDKEGEMTLNEKFNRSTKGFLVFGHHTLWFYLLHQVIYIGLMLFIAGLCMGIPLGV